MSLKEWNPPELAHFIESHRDEILKAWEARVRSEVEPAKEQGKVALRNSLPEFLTQIAKSILIVAAPVAGELSAHGIHGKQRSTVTTYSLTQVMREYSILRFTLFEILEAKSQLPAFLRDKIIAAIDEAMCESANAFADDKKAGEHLGRLDAEGERDRIELAADVLRGELKSMERASVALKMDRDVLQGEVKFIRDERDTSRDKTAELTADAGVRERFVATLAHDLRNPLGAIRMAFEILLDELPERPEIAELSSLMQRNIARTETMLRDLLDTHRIRAGHPLSMTLEYCDLAVVARDAIKDLAAEHGDRFSLKSDDQVLGLWDAERCRRLLENLLTNAIKYGESKRIISVVIDQDDRQITIKVHNFGRPIPPEEQTTLFDAQYQAKSAKCGKTKSWGLGLTLVSGVVEGHGGQVAVASSTSDGTTFTVTLPKRQPSPTV